LHPRAHRVGGELNEHFVDRSTVRRGCDHYTALTASEAVGDEPGDIAYDVSVVVIKADGMRMRTYTVHIGEHKVGRYALDTVFARPDAGLWQSW
jgi:hypothetical protein